MKRDNLALVPALIVGSIILGLAMGTRNAFSGLWMQPISSTRGWGREVFSFAIALQNLIWGAAQPFIGLLADRKGVKSILIAGGVLYAVGLAGVALFPSPMLVSLFGGVVMGLAVACTTYTVVYTVLGKLVTPHRRSWAFGIAAAAGSFGQFLMIPLGQWFITNTGWANALIWLGALMLAVVPLGIALANYGDKSDGSHLQASQQKLSHALREAFSDRSFVLLTLGYFVCGFQVVFIGAHLAPYLLDRAVPSHVGVTALALIGLFNVMGTYIAGVVGQHLPKRKILAAIYLLRSVAISLFIWAPLSPMSVYIFAAVIGMLWLSTVPPTNALVAQRYGVKFLGLLSGIVFFSHQVGSFLGVWLGGRLFDAYGSYNIMWGVCIALGLFAALVHWPIDERSIEAQRAMGVAA